MSLEKVKVYTVRTNRNLARRSSYAFRGEPETLAGWITAPFGSELKWQKDVIVLLMPKLSLDHERKAFTPHMARMYAMRGEYGLKWEENPGS